MAAHEYPFVTNRDCPFFPCHEGIDPEEFNCLFCYCPLYMLGDDCGGNFTRTSSGVKNCTTCTLPHEGDNGTHLVKAHWEQVVARAAATTAAQEDVSGQEPASGNADNGAACGEGDF